ncbi:MAG: cation-translocating P-type ATPase [Gemmatimonadota bacterium]
MEQVARSRWHAVSIGEVYEALETRSSGLTGEEAAARLLRHGPNELPAADDGGAWRVLVRQVHDPLIYVLLGSTGLAMLTGKVLDGLVILGVIVLNAIIGFVQEYRAGQAIKALSSMVRSEATVLRDGQRRQVPSAELVPGDVVLLQSGDKVPADLRLVEARSLKVEEAALTGESVPVEKGVEPVAEEAGIGDRRSMTYKGTLVTYGTATGVVAATGAGTEMGRISRMLAETSELETPLTRQLAVVGTWIAAAIVAVSVLLFAIGLLRGYPLGDAVLAAVTLAVAAIPEGLPAIVTIALAIGVQRMARRRAIIRKLPAVETLGSTTVICSDKTGTLTRNEMTVKVLRTPSGRYGLTGSGYRPEGALEGGGEEIGEAIGEEGVPADVRELVRAGVLCSDAELVEADGGWTVAGDPTEGALVVAGRKLGVEAEAVRRERPRVDVIPFESERQYMATLHEEPDGGRVVYLKGAPEEVLRRCTVPEGEGPRSSFEGVAGEVERIASEGMRVLAFAARRLPAGSSTLDPSAVDDGFRFLGLQGMIDPPRPEAVEAVRACQAAGIEVKMITGDHPRTARAIGRQLGLAVSDSPVTGAELSRMDESGLRRALLEHSVFARVAPEHKLRLVQALQAERQVVAMTGDGVNDAPSLKQADIGVAMGVTGTAVSREAADMILTDDNFATIRAAVEEGRRVYDNLIKALAFILPTNLGLALIMTAAVAFFPVVNGQPLLPMLPVQILWINLVAAVALALPLALETMEPDIMERPPRPPDAPVLSGFVLGRTAVVAALMAGAALSLFLHEYGAHAGPGSLEQAMARGQTEAVTTVILFQIFYLLNCRSLRDSLFSIGFWGNPWVFVGIGAVLLLQIGFIYLPFMNAVFGSAPLRLVSWFEATALAFLVMPFIGLEKWWRKRRSGDSGPAAPAMEPR